MSPSPSPYRTRVLQGINQYDAVHTCTEREICCKERAPVILEADKSQICWGIPSALREGWSPPSVQAFC